MPSATEWRRRQTRIHEAGHAIMLLPYGFDYVEVVENPTDRRGGFVRLGKRTRMQPPVGRLVAVAGATAEWIDGSRAGDPVAAVREDLRAEQFSDWFHFTTYACEECLHATDWWSKDRLVLPAEVKSQLRPERLAGVSDKARLLAETGSQWLEERYPERHAEFWETAVTAAVRALTESWSDVLDVAMALESTSRLTCDEVTALLFPWRPAA